MTGGGVDVRPPTGTNHNPCRLTKLHSITILTGMKSVGIRKLKSRLNDWVRLAASGETILVTDRDRVVAELGPPKETRSPVLADALLADAVRSGVLTPPLLAGSGPPPSTKPVAPLNEILAQLDENRRDR